MVDSQASVRMVAIESLVTLGRYYSSGTAPLSQAAIRDLDPRVRSAAIKALTAFNIPSPPCQNNPKCK